LGTAKELHYGDGFLGRRWRSAELLKQRIIISRVTVPDLRGSLGIDLEDGKRIIHGLGKPTRNNKIKATLIRARLRSTIQERRKRARTTIITTMTTQDERGRIKGEVTKQGTNGGSQQAKSPRRINTLQARTNQGEREID